MIGAAVSRGDNRAGAIVGTFVGVASGAAKDAKANAPKDVEIPAATSSGSCSRNRLPSVPRAGARATADLTRHWSRRSQSV